MEIVMRRAKRFTAITTLAVLVAACAVPLTTVAAARGKLTAENGTAIEIDLSIKAAGTVSADLIEQGDRTRLVVSLTDLPADLTNPSLIAEIHHGICGDLRRAPDYAVESTLASYLPAPYYVGGIFPVSLATLRDGAHAITVRTGPEAGNIELACGNIR
jgi:hypothetical protein